MAVKKGRYQINMDVLLFPWNLAYKNHGSGLVPKGSFGKVHLAQDSATRKRMACKLVSPAEQKAGTQPALTSRNSCQTLHLPRTICSLVHSCVCTMNVYVNMTLFPFEVKEEQCA